MFRAVFLSKLYQKHLDFPLNFHTFISGTLLQFWKCYYFSSCGLRTKLGINKSKEA